MSSIDSFIQTLSNFVAPETKSQIFKENCQFASTSFLFDTQHLDQSQFLMPSHSVNCQEQIEKIVFDFKATEFARASQLLLDLSINRASLLTLEKRMELLAKALVCLDSANGQINQMRGEICEKLDLAMVQQKIRIKLQLIPNDSQTLKRSLQKLDNQLLAKNDLLKLTQDYNLLDIQKELYGNEEENKENKENLI